MRFFINTILVSLLISQAILAEDAIIKLKDGTVINGEVLEEIGEKFIKVKTTEGNYMTINMDEVSTITYTGLEEREPSASKLDYLNVFRVGFLTTIGGYRDNRWGENEVFLFNYIMTLSYKTYSIGLGAGFTIGGYTDSTLPLYFDFHYFFPVGKTIIPNIFVDAGFYFAGEDEGGGGLLFGGGFGVRIGENRVRMDLEPVYIGMHHTETEWDWYNNRRISKSGIIHQVGFRGGVSF
ncbi:MAG: hypothetical protein B6D57_01235 [Candidatus Coatesbacteria bacterium 4484_99]|uniref:Outer membrane protein beta-barrel domain-containing protein n=1 Tax=Candidatus Coatesbacteria bacterium 4484_99 TaxID=1970774 RepID=A0A1W9S2J0_9BACT|nr:MAG: hypothetical protein B6D57_01235 [Candidatus Coatesbacteria bacterium 4484_99]